MTDVLAVPLTFGHAKPSFKLARRQAAQNQIDIENQFTLIVDAALGVALLAENVVIAANSLAMDLGIDTDDSDSGADGQDGGDSSGDSGSTDGNGSGDASGDDGSDDTSGSTTNQRRDFFSICRALNLDIEDCIAKLRPHER